MRSTKAPAGDLPLGNKNSDVSVGNRTAGGEPAVAARLSLCAGLFAFLLNGFSNSGRFHLSYGARLGIVGVCAVLILLGVVLAVVAVRSQRRQPRPRVMPFLVTAIVVNGVLLAMLVYGVARALLGR